MKAMEIGDAGDQLRGVMGARLQIFGGEPSVEQANAFLAGFDVASGYSLLRGYQEWLVVRLGGGYNIHWFALGHKLALGVGPYDPTPTSAAGEQNDAGVRVLEFVVEFLEEMGRLDGRRNLYVQYEAQRVADGLPDASDG